MVVSNNLRDEIRQQAVNHINTNFTHIALSTNSTTPTGAEQTFDNETIREEVLSDIQVTNQVVKKLIFLNSREGNGNIYRTIADFNSSTQTQPNSINLFNADMVEKDNQHEFLLSVRYNVEVTEINN